MNDRAWTPVIARGEPGFSLGVADRGIAGYTPLRETLIFATWAEAQREAAARNALLGLSRDEAMEIVTSSMAAQNRGF